MEETFQPSVSHFQNRIAAIEAIELSVLGFIVWAVGVLISIKTSGDSLVDLILIFLVIEGSLLGSWAIYNAYIRLARAGGRFVDYGLWVAAFFLTSTYALWCWIILDINRFLLAKFLYCGEAPVEFAVSWRSKARRKVWEQAHKAYPS